MKKFTLFVLLAILLIPVFSFAQTLPPQVDPFQTGVTPGQINPFPNQVNNNYTLPPQTSPQVTSPQSSGSGFFCTFSSNPKLGDLFDYFTCIISKSVIPLIFTLALMMFIWGVVQYVLGAEEEAKREKGRSFMIWGIVALAVMFSVWGLVSVVGNTFGIQNVIPKAQVR